MNRTFREVADRRPGLEPPQFSLRVLFLLITAVALSIGLGRWAGPIGTFVGILTVLSILAHMASTAIGGQLRRNGGRPVRNVEADDDTIPTVQPTSAIPSDFARATQLSHFRPLTRKPIYLGICFGAFIGATLATVVLTIVMWHNLSVVNVAFGACSAAVVGSFIGFWVSSLVQVARNAWQDAEQG